MTSSTTFTHLVGQQIKVQRAHAPIFDVVIELRRSDQGGRPPCTVYKDVAAVVDALLGAKTFTYEERRVRDDGALFIKKGSRCRGEFVEGGVIG